jgi:hypothetical protein
MTTETNRREFEEWVVDYYHESSTMKYDNGDYINVEAVVAWESWRAAWQAARERDKRIIEVLKDGLQTDGAHHKQWYLNEVLKLIEPDVAKDVEMHWTHDGGIAP